MAKVQSDWVCVGFSLGGLKTTCMIITTFYSVSGCLFLDYWKIAKGGLICFWIIRKRFKNFGDRRKRAHSQKGTHHAIIANPRSF